MGWYSGNPSDLNNLPPEPAAKKYVEYMGGEEAVMKRARAETIDKVSLREITLDQAISSGAMKVEGNREAFTDFMGLLDTFDFWFNIVTP
jgi:alkyl sulfatase BDS1-like metallo-beta-lactamase superfamily hydrolase